MRKNETTPPGGILTLLLLVLNAVALEAAYVRAGKGYAILLFTLPLLLLSIIINKSKTG